MPRARLEDAVPVDQATPAASGRASLSDISDATTSTPKEKEGFLSSAAESSGLSSLPNALMHPIDTISNIPGGLLEEANRSGRQLKEAWNTPNNEPMKAFDRTLYGIPFIGGSLKKADQQYKEGNLSGAAGTMAGMLFSIAAPTIAGKVIGNAAVPLREAGGGVFNKTAGLLKSDFKHGASNPGLSYLEGGGTPALTLGGLANKASNVVSKTGEKLGNAYDSASASGVNIPTRDVFNELTEPVSKLRNLQSGIGGTGVSPALEAYEDSLIPTLSKAENRGGFTPRELFDEVKRPIAQNTRWNDPTMYDLNKVRQETTGRIGGLLSRAVPETAPLNKIYQGASRLADRAESRAETGTPTLSKIGRRGVEGIMGAGLGYATHNPALAAIPIIADSVPVRTASGYTLFKAGQAAPSVSRMLLSKPGRASLFPIRRNEDEQ